MKILHVYKDYWPILGGIEGNLQAIAERQVRAGHDVTVLVTNPSKLPAQAWINGVRLLRAHRWATVASTPLSWELPRLLRKTSADITHLHFPYPLGEISQWLFGRAPFVITYHSDIVKQKGVLRFYRPILHQILRRARRIMPTSQPYIASSPFLAPLRHNCTPIPLGIDPTPFLQAEPLPQLRSRRTQLLFVGRHRYYKGVDTLLRAMPFVEADLLVAGDGPMRAEWECLAQSLGLEQKVRFLGDISAEDLPRLYHSADLFVLPSNSRAEAFGIVLMEAMAAGLPCVTSELGTGTSFIVQDGQTGRVVPPQEPRALADALNQLSADPHLRQQMGERGRQRMLAEFTIDRMVERIGEVYEELQRR